MIFLYPFLGRRLLAVNDTELFKCIPSGITSFPGDFFTQEQRREGGILIHMMLTAYICAMIAVVCDDYFIPSLDTISASEGGLVILCYKYYFYFNLHIRLYAMVKKNNWISYVTN